MPTVAELTALYGNFMVGPRPGPAVCRLCFNFTHDGFEHCYACSHCQSWLDAVCPISYSVAQEQLHHALRGYKRLEGAPARRLTVELAAVLWRHLTAHEKCLARAANCPGFNLVTTVPSGNSNRDERHPLRHIVGELVEPTKARYEPLLHRSHKTLGTRTFDPERYEPTRALTGQSVLLIDDTWTTGISAQSAAAALKRAGGGTVGAVVIGRHLNRGWHENDQRLRKVDHPFDWSRCALCGEAGVG